MSTDREPALPAGLADHVRLAVDGGVATVTLERPEKRNALTRAMRDRLAVVFAVLDAEPAILVAILTGVDESFCAGVDLAEGSAGTGGHPLSTPPAPVTAPLDAFRKPLIAAINGPAMGGGLELALACDLRIASQTARFGLPEVRIGSLPGSGGISRLVRAVPAAVAARIVLTGETIDAPTAAAIGLVSDVVAPADLAARAAELGATIAANAPLSILAATRSLRDARNLSLAAGLAQDRTLWAWLSASDDRSEGRAAFRERRPPRFTGR